MQTILVINTVRRNQCLNLFYKIIASNIYDYYIILVINTLIQLERNQCLNFCYKGKALKIHDHIIIFE